MSNNFDELLAELTLAAEEQSTLAKAMPADDGEDDEAIADAAEEGKGEEANPEDGEGGEAGGEEGGEGEGKPMAKSMTVDGEEFQVVEVDQLIKSLTDLTGRVETNEGVLAKALETTLGTIKTQGEMIKSLNAKVEKLAGQGRGRKTVLAISEKPEPGATLAKSHQPEAPKPGEVLAKALSAQQAGRITAHDVSRCEIAFQSGVAMPADVLARI